jgi:excisionase family DNA binding protein
MCYNVAGKSTFRGQTMLKEIDNNRERITTPQASIRSGLSKVHLARLLREGKIEGVQLGREWLVYADSLAKYIATPHKSGPKGPIKKAPQKQSEQETHNSQK